MAVSERDVSVVTATPAPTRGSRDGNELSALGKIAYKPFGLIFGMISGLLASKIFAIVWKRYSDEDETPKPLSDDYSTREVLLAAAVQGAIFGLIKAAVDRYGMKGVRRFLDAPRAPAARRA
jgi:hypothetical protein